MPRRKSRTNFNSSIVVQMGTRRCAAVWNGFEPASSELRYVTCHIVNPPLVFGKCSFPKSEREGGND